MPVWADTNGGPLNYIQIQSLIAFIRAPSTQQFVIRNPSLDEPVLDANGNVETFHGWLDPNYKPAPSASPVPDCWSATASSSASQGPAASLAPGATTLTLTALNIAFDKQALEVAANQPFGIDFKNEDGTGTFHNVQIRKADGTVIDDPPTIDGGAETTYAYAALPPGTYMFICKIHPITQMTGTLTVQ